MMYKIGILCGLCLFLFSCQDKVEPTATQRSQKRNFTVQKAEAEWKESLSRQQYYVLREADTEPPHSSPLIELTAEGEIRCAACGNPLFDMAHKYTTTSSWPSFDRAIEGAVVYANDYKLGYRRTEVLCAQCGGHLGHVFKDGPKETTGKRFCINGASLEFVPREGGESLVGSYE